MSPIVMVMLVSGSAVLLAVLSIDQWTKQLAQSRLSSQSVACGKLLQLRFLCHRRKLYQSNAVLAAHVVTWLIALTSAAALYRGGAFFRSPLALLGLAVAFGGAAGNLVDILRKRYVVDFIDLHWWPVFNLADVAIVAGLAAAFWPGS